MLLETLALGRHVAELAVGHLLAEKLADAISSMRAERNHDLERAIAVAFEHATRTQEEHARTQDEKLIWRQLHDKASTLFAVDSDGFPFAVLDALVIGDEQALREALTTVIAHYIRDISPDVRGGFQRQLARAFLFEFGEVLKQGEYEKAWNAFLRTILRKTYQQLTAQVTTLAEDQRHMFTHVLQRLDGLASGFLQFPHFTAQVTTLAEDQRHMLAMIAEVLRRLEHLASSSLDLPTSEPPVAEKVAWAPDNKGMQPGIIVREPRTYRVDWSTLEEEIKTSILNRLDEVPLESKVRVNSDKVGKPNMIVAIVVNGNVIGHIWFGGDPTNEWQWDGLIRVGAFEPVKVWGTFQRYSDGSYLGVAAHDINGVGSQSIQN